MKNFPPEALEAVAAYFQTLAEPTRLQILNFLRQGERNVGELAQLCGCTAANVSRHLALLTKQGIFVGSVKDEGTSVYYLDCRCSRPIYTLCDLVCDNIARAVGARCSAPAGVCSASSYITRQLARRWPIRAFSFLDPAKGFVHDCFLVVHRALRPRFSYPSISRQSGRGLAVAHLVSPPSSALGSSLPPSSLFLSI